MPIPIKDCDALFHEISPLRHREKSISATTQGASVRLCHLGRKFHEALQITKLLTVFDVYDTQVTAVSSFEEEVRVRTAGIALSEICRRRLASLRKLLSL
jgi:hypothetical protein